jgi:hypothetical protein
MWINVVTLENLESATKYVFEIVLVETNSTHEEARRLVSKRSFTTFPPVLSPQKFTFNHGSCLMYAYFKTFNSLRFWVDQPVAFGILLGDSVYLDTFGTIPPEQAYSQVRLVSSSFLFSRFFLFALYFFYCLLNLFYSLGVFG